MPEDTTYEQQTGTRSKRRWGLKYAVEWAAAAAGVVALSPLLAGLSALIKLTSKGPVLYISDRLGKDGKSFKLYKFRSMRVDAEQILADDGQVITVENDPRITPMGKVLRLGFDELPQLLNVLKGDMCIIGPRPDLTWEMERYSHRERLRVEVLPGITGFTQVVDGRDMNNAQNYELDVRYVEHADAGMDLLVLLLTLPYSLGARSIGKQFFGPLLSGIEALDDQVSAARGGGKIPAEQQGGEDQ